MFPPQAHQLVYKSDTTMTQLSGQHRLISNLTIKPKSPSTLDQMSPNRPPELDKVIKHHNSDLMQIYSTNSIHKQNRCNSVITYLHQSFMVTWPQKGKRQILAREIINRSAFPLCAVSRKEAVCFLL